LTVIIVDSTKSSLSLSWWNWSFCSCFLSIKFHFLLYFGLYFFLNFRRYSLRYYSIILFHIWLFYHLRLNFAITKVEINEEQYKCE